MSWTQSASCSGRVGWNQPFKPLIELVTDAGGKEDASILGFGGRVPAAAAAFANGTLAHGLDFDSQTPWGAHPDSSLVPALLALAERKGDVTGKELITAVAIGQELFIRLRCNVGWHMDWNLSGAVGRVLRCRRVRIAPGPRVPSRSPTLWGSSA